MAGLGGAFLSLAYTPMWVEDMTAGRGWIALALVVFATWRPWRAAGRRLSVRRRDHPAALRPGHGRDRRAGAGHVDAALPRHHRRAGASSPPARCAAGSMRRPASASRSTRRPDHDASSQGDQRHDARMITAPRLRARRRRHRPAACAAGARPAFAAGAAQGRLRLCRPDRRRRLDLPPRHRPARRSRRHFGDKVKTNFVENVPRARTPSA